MIIKAVTSAEMREIDRISIEEIGIPSSVLMNNAGKAVAGYIQKKFNKKNIVIFCGAGNNGGDGFTAAYYLLNNGHSPRIYLSGKKHRVSETSKIFLNLCEKMKIPIIEVDETSISSICIPEHCIVVDAILGTGFEGPAAGIPLEFIKTINNSDCTVVSIDIPSGLCSNGIMPEGDFVKADFTITIGLPKISLVSYPCKAFCGEVVIKDIGFPSSLTMNEELKVTLINNHLFKNINIFNNNPDIHKGDKGHTLLIGGFVSMEGAALLTASALFKTGCGLLTIATEKKSRNIIAGKIPEAMTLSFSADPESFIPADFMQSGKFTTLMIGPGLGRGSYPEKIFTKLIRSLDQTGIKKVLIDGDGLYHLAGYLSNEKLPGGIDFIITPHFMEASRLLNRDISSIKNDRLTGCKELAEHTGCITVLKGPSSIISDGKNSYINTNGNNGLATAGSGDVLSGIIGAFMNMNISVIEAAIAGVFIHGLCADIYSETATTSTMSSSDIISNIRTAIKINTVKTDL